MPATTTTTHSDTEDTPNGDPVRQTVAVGDTTLAVEVRGEGEPLLLIHGGGEDAAMLAGQADNLAAAGFQVVTYDRRGTGKSGRDAWPGNGAAQHADDAAALLEALGIDDATVLGVSSGGVVALTLAARHPAQVGSVIAWEPPAIGLLPGAEQINAEIMAPIDDHLAAHPGDFVGAQALLLTTILGFPVTTDDPAFASTRANAEPMIRDEPAITLQSFEQTDLADADITIALGSNAVEPIEAAAAQIADWTGRDPVRVDADHEVYLADPSVLTGIVTTIHNPA